MKKLLLTLLVPALFSFRPVPLAKVVPPANVVPLAEVTPPVKGKAVVYFAKTSAGYNLASLATNFNFFDKEQFIGKFSGTGYLRYECEPGEHVFWCRAENSDFMTAELEADKIYFVLAEVHIAFATASVELRPIDPHNKKDNGRVKNIVKLIEKKEPDVTTPQEIAQEEKKKDEHARAIKNYEDGKKGKIERLTKEMFYEKE